MHLNRAIYWTHMTARVLRGDSVESLGCISQTNQATHRPSVLDNAHLFSDIGHSCFLLCCPCSLPATPYFLNSSLSLHLFSFLYDLRLSDRWTALWHSAAQGVNTSQSMTETKKNELTCSFWGGIGVSEYTWDVCRWLGVLHRKMLMEMTKFVKKLSHLPKKFYAHLTWFLIYAKESKCGRWKQVVL